MYVYLECGNGVTLKSKSESSFAGSGGACQSRPSRDPPSLQMDRKTCDTCLSTEALLFPLTITFKCKSLICSKRAFHPLDWPEKEI